MYLTDGTLKRFSYVFVKSSSLKKNQIKSLPVCLLTVYLQTIIIIQTPVFLPRGDGGRREFCIKNNIIIIILK